MVKDMNGCDKNDDIDLDWDDDYIVLDFICC